MSRETAEPVDGGMPTAAAVRALASAFAGEIVLPSDEGYDAARAVWNATVDRRPALVLRPAGVADVVEAVRFAREEELDVAVRGGGHSIAGFSTCDGGVVIDLSALRGVRVDPARRTAVAAGGAHLAELDREAQRFGLACPVGVVGHTGVAGLTLGGGMGRLQRSLGLTIDNLRSVELVTADGRVVRASATENADLFWGLRGAGANFGIATSLELGLHPVGPRVTHGSVLHPIERAAAVAAAFRDTLERAPDELWLSLNLALALPAAVLPEAVAGRPVAVVSAMHCGPPAAAERDLATLRAFGPPVVDSIAEKPHLQVQLMNDDAMRWGRRFYMKSAFVSSLPDELVEAAAQQLSRVPDGADGAFSAWAWGGAIAAVPEAATAFTGRGAAFWAAAEIVWEDPALDARCREWSRALIAAVAPFAAEGRYVNDVAETEDLARAIYGGEKYDRLVALKRAWDPDNVFRLNQNIRP